MEFQMVKNDRVTVEMSAADLYTLQLALQDHLDVWENHIQMTHARVMLDRVNMVVYNYFPCPAYEAMD